MLTFSGERTGEGTPLNQRTGRRHTYRSSSWRSATFNERMPPPIGVVSGPLIEPRYSRPPAGAAGVGEVGFGLVISAHASTAHRAQRVARIARLCTAHWRRHRLLTA